MGIHLLALAAALLLSSGGAAQRPRTCSPVASSSHSHQYICTFSGKEIRCDQPMKPSSTASLRCNDFYEKPTIKASCTEQGLWSRTILPCTPKCGEFNFSLTSAQKKSSKIPWNAAILTKDHNGDWTFGCSGTIISPRTIVSAAHCVWSDVEKQLRHAEEFSVVVGKYEQGPEESPSNYTQHIMVDKIHIPTNFRGNERRYESDISLLILKNEIIMNEVVRPVCVDYSNRNAPYLIPGKVGIVGSWGVPSASKTYKQSIVSFPYVDFEECLRNLPREFHPFLTSDKFCAGSLKSATVCTGDSGTGFAVQFSDGKWYLTGISSIGVPADGDEGCETKYYKGFTGVGLYVDLIKTLVAVSEDIDLTTGIPTSLQKCNGQKFECISGECIDQNLLCDGRKHCSDGSDETTEECQHLRCEETSFKCRYGACIDKKFVCNGMNECEDGSDEDPTRCKKQTVNQTSSSYLPSSGCLLPRQPENGHYRIIGLKDDNHPDNIVPAGVLLNFSCNAGFVLNGASLIFCYDGWTSEPSTCIPVLCEPLQNPSRDIQCIFERYDVDCLTRPVKPGTRASVKCKINYESIPGLLSYDMICESNGRWSRELQSCVPKCGIPNPVGVPFIGFGYKAHLAEFPWHIGLYRSLPNGTVVPSCGGSIVSTRVIVSAAHCFWENDKKDFSQYKVVAGKYYYAWEHKLKYVQHLEIQDVVLPQGYKGFGEKNNANDIAVIILKYAIHFNEAVRPVCVDYEKNYLRYFTPYGTTGNVTGWGLNENQTYSEVLKIANLRYVDNEECERNTPIPFHSFLTNDKFCAGNRNKTTVCPGDSGGGYTVTFKNGRSYLVGIVSAGPSDICSQYAYVAFTNVYNHLELIRNIVYT